MSILEEIIIIVGVAVASASLLLFMYSYITTKRHQLVLEDRKLEFEYRTRDYELSSRLAHSDSENVSPSLVSELLSRQDALLNRLESITYSPKALADSVSRLNAIVDLLQAQEEKPQQQQQELLARLDRLTAGIPTREEHAPDELASQEEHVAFIRELAHSLNTPLSQIEAAALLLQEAPKQESTATASSRSPASRIYQSAEICKAFLSAFMQITKVASQTSKWNPKSLEESLAAAAELYAEKSNPQVKSKVYINAEPQGYPTSYTLAVTLPLLENAFEAARPDSTVTTEITTERGEYRINVTSVSDKIPEGDSMYESGFTTKMDHQGLGLSVVRRLLSAYQGATITHEIEGDQTSFHISLPRGRHE